jgi:hypothetical protein
MSRRLLGMTAALLLTCAAVVRPAQVSAQGQYEDRLAAAISVTLSGASQMSPVSREVQHRQWHAAEVHALRAFQLFREGLADLHALKPASRYASVQSLLNSGVTSYTIGAGAVLQGARSHQISTVVRGIKSFNRGSAIVRRAATKIFAITSAVAAAVAADTAYRNGITGAITTATSGTNALKPLAADVKAKRYGNVQKDASKAIGLFTTAQNQLSALTPPSAYAHAQSTLAAGLNDYIAGMKTVMQGAQNKQVKTITAGLNRLAQGTPLVKQGIAALP